MAAFQIRAYQRAQDAVFKALGVELSEETEMVDRCWMIYGSLSRVESF